MPYVKTSPGLEQAIVELIRENGTLTVGAEGDYTYDFLAVLDRLATAGIIEVDDTYTGAGQAFRLQRPR